MPEGINNPPQVQAKNLKYEKIRLFGLIGNPLSHSFSQQYFNEKFEKEGLANCSYGLYTLNSINEFPVLLKDNPSFQGLNVTVPFKQQVLRFLDDVTFIPEGLNACNCIAFRSGKLVGYNTDHTAFENSFIPLLRPFHLKALVLGNGGAAAAVLYVLKKHGIPYQIVSRALHDDSTLTYKDLDEKMINEYPVIINTTPLGMHPQSSFCPDIPYQFINAQHLLFDLIYNPASTRFLQLGEEKGAVVKNGMDMLIAQANESWKIWNE